MKTASLALALVAVLVGAPPALADSFLPANTTAQFQGPVQLSSGGIVVTCTATITLVTDGTGADAEITAATLAGGLLCPTLGPTNLPWNVDVNAPVPPPINQPATQLKFFGVQVGGCLGDIVANWNPGAMPPTIAIPPGTPLGGCWVQGTFSQTTTTALTITN